MPAPMASGQKRGLLFVAVLCAVTFVEFAETRPNSARARARAQAPPSSAPTTKAPWGYYLDIDELAPTEWEEEFPACAGARQSPIALNSRPGNGPVAQMDASLKPLDFSLYERNAHGYRWNVVNNGHSVQFSANFTDPPVLRKGSLGSRYVLTQFHFHWGMTDARGSEHVVNGRRYPLELHLVHRKVTDTDDEASRDSTGLAVVSVLFDLAGRNDRPNPAINTLVNAVQQAVIPNEPATVLLQNFRLSDLIPASQAYFRYAGSLTTPPCSEAVTWTVMIQHQKVTESQLNIFRSLHQRQGEQTGVPDADDIEDNFRPVQPANGRLIRIHPEWTPIVPLAPYG